ncbi:hypothetical protein [Polycladomyces subterraneus]|uniref:DUF4178 domain-containing protein n=1 Tax=Polycladomyces subterraneus TaxID=1016997 RepID=A0ABT8IP29_9BACL|nr:hypothetical protein [Polycladomyces subterraneus]MDN4594547.1 hypothetical protein [Polycladomyces subterraneus]
MNKWLNHIHTELHEIYGESYPRFLRAEMIHFAYYPLISLLFSLSFQPNIIRTMGSWGMVGIIVIVFFIMLYLENRYQVKLNQEMKQRYKQTIYYRWISRGLRFVLSILVFLTSFMLPRWLNPPQPIPQAVTEYGYPVQLPAKLPFKPTKQYAVVKAGLFHYEMDVFYEHGDTHLTLYINQDEDQELFLNNATLKNGIKADYEETDIPDDEYEYYDLTWYQKGFSYRLSYSPSKNEPKPTKDVLLNIANSFKPVHS